MVCGQNKLSFDKIVSCNNLISFPSVEHKLRVILTADVKDSETESVSGNATYCGTEISK